MILELVLSISALFLIWDYLNKKHRNEILENSAIPGPKALPILGNALYLRNVNSSNSIQFLRDIKRKYGKVIRFWTFHQLTVIIMEPKYLEIILSSPKIIKKGSLYHFLMDWLGCGLLLSWGKKWHARRKIITPTFHFKILEEFVEIFDQQSAIMVKKLYLRADGETPINIFPAVCLCALDIIAETAMGVKVYAQDQPGLEYVRAIATLSRIMADRFIKPLQRTNFLFCVTAPKLFTEAQRCIKNLHQFTIDVIEQRRSALEQTIQNNSSKKETTETEHTDLNAKKRMALLDVLLQSTVDGQHLTNDDIREEVDTFMFEGHDTTTSSISFTLYLIARHPIVQAKLMAEIEEVLGSDKDKPITYRDLHELKYMDLVIKESQRLYPSVPVIGRQVEKDTKVGDIVLPAQTNVSIPLHLVMRDPDYFTSPNEFKPERFESESDQKIHPFAYTPFSAGPRNCIGQKFAMLEIKSTISKMLRHFELLPLGPDVMPIINIILRSSTGVHIGLRPRSVDHKKSESF